MVDAGYPNTRGYLVPYKGCPYHLQGYRGKGRAHGGKEILTTRTPR